MDRDTRRFILRHELATEEQLNSLNEAQAQDEIIKCLTRRHATIDQILALTFLQCRNFYNELCIDLLFQKNTTFEQVRSLTEEERKNFENYKLRSLFNAGKVTFEDVKSLNRRTSNILKDDSTIKLFDEDRISINFITSLTIQEAANFTSAALRLIADEKASLEDIKSLTSYEADNIIQFFFLIYENKLSFASVKSLPFEENDGINYFKSTRLFINNHPNLQAIFDALKATTLTTEDLRILDVHSYIRNAFYEGILTLTQIEQLNANGRYHFAQLNEQQFTANLLRMDELIAELNARPMPRQALVRGGWDELQTTHLAAVHKSASESAVRLSNRYDTQIADLPTVLDEINTYLNDLEDRTAKPSFKAHRLEEIMYYNPPEGQEDDTLISIINAAKRGFERLNDPRFAHEDPVSEVSILQLLALIWIAAADPMNYKQDVVNPETAKFFVAMALYECQRGYNLDDNHLDDGQPDIHICPGGTFNKHIEMAARYHKDAEIIRLDPDLALYKFTISRTVSYLQGLTEGAKKLFLDELKDGKYPSDDWKQIKPQVIADMKGIGIAQEKISTVVHHFADIEIKDKIYTPLERVLRHMDMPEIVAPQKKKKGLDTNDVTLASDTERIMESKAKKSKSKEV